MLPHRGKIAATLTTFVSPNFSGSNHVCLHISGMTLVPLGNTGSDNENTAADTVDSCVLLVCPMLQLVSIKCLQDADSGSL